MAKVDWGDTIVRLLRVSHGGRDPEEVATSCCPHHADAANVWLVYNFNSDCTRYLHDELYRLTKTLEIAVFERGIRA